MSNKIEDLDSFIQTFRNEIKRKKKLSPINFDKLILLTKSPLIQKFITLDLTMKEANVLGRAFMKAKNLKIEELIGLFLKPTKQNALILTCLLCKKCKVNDLRILNDFLIPNMRSKSLAYLNLALVFVRNYKQFVSDEFIEEIKQVNHPVCDEILDLLEIEVEKEMVEA
ncbi:hypothetical protein TUBRATIS_11280 [Tubulinosema ratisbonensis]|uniref:Uncharacterized protein n=1 Tax=Tubulinosema ratisbonensis TaxID=291195 RepID=A0A437AMD3_9MICR|nr:hypothetical protein TUBRATIS_11280 [Tubulinosema ratisbonensis]